MVRVESNTSPWLADMVGSVMPVAVAHGEGRPEFRDGDFALVEERRQVALRYVDAKHQVAGHYPDNPNGAPDGLAGLTAANGRVLAMMPHLNGYIAAFKMSGGTLLWGEDGPWLRLFRNARRLF